MADEEAVPEMESQQEGSEAGNKKQNLLKNPCGEGELEHWTAVENGGDCWAVETLPGDNGVEFPGAGVMKYFVTSFELCVKSQTIDLLAEGFSEELLDETQPPIAVEDWYAARTDAGCLYELCVQLQGENHDVLAEFKTEEPVTIEQFNDGSWKKISHTFSEYGPGVRYIMFQHGGQDTLYWKGWYGVRVTNSSVTIEP